MVSKIIVFDFTISEANNPAKKRPLITDQTSKSSHLPPPKRVVLAKKRPHLIDQASKTSNLLQSKSAKKTKVIKSQSTAVKENSCPK